MTIVYTAISVILALAVWLTVSYPGFKSGRVFAPPQKVLTAFEEQAKTSLIWVHIGASVYRVLVGFGLAFVVAVPTSFLMGWYKPFREIVQPWLRFIRCIPPLAFIPLVIVGAGVGESAKIIVIFIAAFLVMVISIYGGVVNVDNTLIKAARVLGANDRTIFLKVIIPASIPYIIIGARLGLSSSLTTLIAAELTGAQRGLGQMIQEAANYFKMDVVLMGIIIIGVVGLLFEKIVSIAERRLTAWQETREM
ncbi:MAG: ABC transporter permease [Planctomycetota bacterium]|nr:ABC transporter permease [Planctomycetota bacterium]